MYYICKRSPEPDWPRLRVHKGLGGQPVPGDLFPRVVCLVRQEYGTNKIYTWHLTVDESIEYTTVVNFLLFAAAVTCILDVYWLWIIITYYIYIKKKPFDTFDWIIKKIVCLFYVLQFSNIRNSSWCLLATITIFEFIDPPPEKWRVTHILYIILYDNCNYNIAVVL